MKRILADNYVRPDEAQKILSILRQRGTYTVIDKITVNLNMKKDTYEAEFSNLGIKGIPITEDYPAKYDRLLCGGIWCIVQLEYEFIEEEKNMSPIHIRKLTPIQMPHVDIEELKQGRKAFTQEEWIKIMLRSIGMEPDKLNDRERWLLLARMLPLVENNFNLCELGPRSTGKSHIYKEISPNSILVSGGQTTVANLFYNMGRKTVGLVGLWDCVAFDEVAGINFKDKDGIQIMKDYMASGSFARGKEEKAATASMVFVGNINQSVDVLLKTSSLFDPFPPEMGTDTAFLDRMHCYIPGWEIPKFRPEHFTNDYGFITDYLAEFVRELRKEQYGDALDKYFRLGKNLNQRDTIAVRKIVGGMLKLLYPDGEFSKEELEEILKFALEMRRRVKEQLKKLGGMEFYDVNFSYIDNETFEEHFVSVPEQGGGKLIPEGMCNPGQVYTVSQGKSGMIGVFRLESQMLPGNGKFERTGLNSDGKCKEAANTAFSYLKANSNRISGAIIVDITVEFGFTKEQVLEYAAQAESYSNHPIAKSIQEAFGKTIDQSVLSGYEEISGHGIRVLIGGKRVLAGNSKLMDSEKVSYAACQSAGTKVYIAVDGRYAGCIVIADEVKDESQNAIASLKKIGVEKTVMLTGDDEKIGKAVAEQLGLDEYYAQLLPDQKVEKLEYLDQHKTKGSKLAFVGDGINDAPVLARADVGIAMGGLGSDAAIEAADVVLMTDEPSKLVDAIDVAKATKRIVMQNIIIALGIKSVFLILGALGIAGMWEAVFGDVGVTIIAVLNAMRILKK